MVEPLELLDDAPAHPVVAEDGVAEPHDDGLGRRGESDRIGVAWPLAGGHDGPLLTAGR